MPRTMLVVRLMLASKEAEQEAVPVIETVRQFAPSVTVKAEPYWKIPEYEEVSVETVLQSDGEQELTRVMRLVGLGWNVGGREGEKSAVWRGEGTPTLPSLRWANIETFPVSAISTE